MTRRSKVLEKSSDLFKVTQQLKPKAEWQKEDTGVEAGTGEDSLEKTQLGLKLEGGARRGKCSRWFAAPRFSILWVGILQRELQGPEVVSTPTPSDGSTPGPGGDGREEMGVSRVTCSLDLHQEPFFIERVAEHSFVGL